MRLQFEKHPEEAAYHACESRREGQWLIFTCPKCPHYERRFNYHTGEMQVLEAAPDPAIRHVGTYSPPALEQGQFNPN